MSKSSYKDCTDKFIKNMNDKGLTGLSNLGNTCFMNSTLQCLSHSIPLVKLMNKYFKDGNPSPNFMNNNNENDGPTDGSDDESSQMDSSMNDISHTQISKNCSIDVDLFKEWYDLHKLMWSENCTVSPGRFLRMVQNEAAKKNIDIFTGYSQNDLPEFLLFVIDSFHNCIRRPVSMKISGNPENNNDIFAKSVFETYKTMYEKEYSEIIDLFFGNQISFMSDMEDNVLSHKAEPLFMIDLPIPEAKTRQKTVSLKECLNKYIEPEVLSGDNQWYYEKEDKKIDAKKCIKFFNLGEIIVIDLKRFTYDMKKINTMVTFPINNLDMGDYICGYNNNSYKYELFGVCNHFGSCMGGHYTAYIRNTNNKWYHFNDTRVDEIPVEKVVSPSAYCLFYIKKK